MDTVRHFLVNYVSSNNLSSIKITIIRIIKVSTMKILDYFFSKKHIIFSRYDNKFSYYNTVSHNNENPLAKIISPLKYPVSSCRSRPVCLPSFPVGANCIRPVFIPCRGTACRALTADLLYCFGIITHCQGEFVSASIYLSTHKQFISSSNLTKYITLLYFKIYFLLL